MILATITLTFSLNNVILLMNFYSLIIIVGIELSVSNIEITLLILVIYESSLLCLFLVNGILLMSAFSFNHRIYSYFYYYCSFSYYCSFLYCSFCIIWLFIINYFIPLFVYLFQSINYLDSNSSLYLYFPFSSLFNIGFNRVGNLFDNSLFHLIVLIFYVSIVNILSLFQLC